MNFRTAVLGASFLACSVAACDATKENTSHPGENREVASEKEMAAEETTSVDAMQKPTTIAERREMREQLANLRATQSGRSQGVPTVEVNPIRGEVPDEMLEKIIADLAMKIQADRAGIDVRHAESLTWNDGSLGCGKPGQVYTQALVPGYRVILIHAGQQFDYHAADKGYFMLCERPLLAAPGAGNDPPAE